MLKNSNYLKQSYQKSENKTNKIIKVNDIVKVNNRHYMISSINNNSFECHDMYSQKAVFFIDDIQKIVYDSNQQTNIQDFLYENEKTLLTDTLKDINQKLKNPILSLTNIKTLKVLKRKTLEKLNSLEIEKVS